MDCEDEAEGGLVTSKVLFRKEDALTKEILEGVHERLTMIDRRQHPRVEACKRLYLKTHSSQFVVSQPEM